MGCPRLTYYPYTDLAVISDGLSLKCILQNPSKETGYRFNAKELDEETGNYYYGARYYNPKTSLWLSVDRMASKYPVWSPYNFTMNNPINMIDPNGYLH